MCMMFCFPNMRQEHGLPALVQFRCNYEHARGSARPTLCAFSLPVAIQIAGVVGCGPPGHALPQPALHADGLCVCPGVVVKSRGGWGVDAGIVCTCVGNGPMPAPTGVGAQATPISGKSCPFLCKQVPFCSK